VLDDRILCLEDVLQLDARRIHAARFQRYVLQKAGLQVDVQVIDGTLGPPVTRFLRTGNLHAPCMPWGVRVAAIALLDESRTGV
jgi:hypothetical protein